MIQDLCHEFPVRVLCQAVRLSPSTYYYQPRDNDDLSVLSWLEDVLLRFPTYGCLRLARQLQREGHRVNHKRVERILRENDLIRVVKRRCTTTNSVHGYRRYPNLLRLLEVTRPNQVWRADITYVQLPRGFAACNRRGNAREQVCSRRPVAASAARLKPGRWANSWDHRQW
jgi:putative transposase